MYCIKTFHKLLCVTDCVTAALNIFLFKICVAMKFVDDDDDDDEAIVPITIA